MSETYLGAVSRFAFRRTIAVTDTLSIILAILVPAIAFVLRKPMADWLPGLAAWVAIIFIGGGILLRFLTAPYFIWREQNKTIADLRQELAKPEQSIKARMHADAAETRVELLNQLMRIHARFGEETYDPIEYYKCLRHEGTAIPAAKLGNDEKFAALWKAHIELLSDAVKWENSQVYLLKVRFDRVDQSHQQIVRHLQFKS